MRSAHSRAETAARFVATLLRREKALADLADYISGPLGVHFVLAVASTAERAPRSAHRGSEASRGAAEPCLAVFFSSSAKSPAARRRRGGLVMSVVVVQATIRYNYLRFVDILDTPPTRSSNQPPAAVP